MALFPEACWSRIARTTTAASKDDTGIDPRSRKIISSRGLDAKVEISMRKIVGGAPQSCFQSIYRKGSGRVQRVELQASSSQMLARLAGLSFHSISYPIELQIPCPNVDAQAFTCKPQPP